MINLTTVLLLTTTCAEVTSFEERLAFGNLVFRESRNQVSFSEFTQVEFCLLNWKSRFRFPIDFNRDLLLKPAGFV